MIERGETWILDADMRVYTLTVEGTLIWDTTKDDLKISTKYVLGKSLTVRLLITKNQSLCQNFEVLPYKIYLKLANLGSLNWDQNRIQ